MANYLQLGQKSIHFTRGSHNFPRFIYHMTSKENYKRIVKTGKLTPSPDTLCGKGIFAIDLTNFFRFWQRCKIQEDYIIRYLDLQQSLIDQVRKGSSNIVILRIPTAKLDVNALKIRSQNRACSWTRSTNGEKFLNRVAERARMMGTHSPNDKKWETVVLNYVRKNLPLSAADLKGISAKFSRLLKQRKEAIEFIYPEEIPLSGFQKIGEVNLTTLGEAPTMRQIFTRLLQGTPEYKGAKLLKG